METKESIFSKVKSENLKLDPDTYVYRYLPLEAFIDMVVTQKNTLTSLAMQTDQFEGGVYSLNVEFAHKDLMAPFEGSKKNIYIQCWTTIENSEGMWKAYSNGTTTRTVKIKCKAGNLFDSLLNTNEVYYPNCYMLPLRYKKQNAINSILVKSAEKLSSMTWRELAEQMTLKRDDFNYEHEVRLLYIDIFSLMRKPILSEFDGKTMKCPFDIGEIEEVMLDPWSKPYYFDSIKVALKNIGFDENKIVRCSYFDAKPTISIDSTRDDFLRKWEKIVLKQINDDKTLSPQKKTAYCEIIHKQFQNMIQ